MTLADIIAAVRILLQDDQYDQATIVQAANWFVFELFNNNRTRLMEDSVTLSASQGDTTVAFPDNLLAWISVYATAPRVFDMSDDMLSYNDFMGHFANFATATQAQAGKWTPYNNAIRFTAPLNADHTFQVDFVREPVPMTDPTEDCEVPGRYIELVARGTKARILEIEEDYDFAQQERDILDPLMTTFIRNEARGGGKTRPTVIGTRRRRNPYSDTGTPSLRN